MEPLTSVGIRETGRARAAESATRMTPAERSSSLWLSSLSASRMLGMFLILPVFAVHAASLPGGSDSFRIGLAMGIYGLTQALLQIPFGMASDRFGRKPVITVGLLLMVIGSVIAAAADTVDGLTVGRAIQGAGAVSAAIAALLADNTRDSQRSKAMAMMGAMIGVSFAISLVISSPLYHQVGLSGLFLINGGIALLGIALLWWRIPSPPPDGSALAGGTTAAGKTVAGNQAIGNPSTGNTAIGNPSPANTAIGNAVPSSLPGRWPVIRDPDLLRLNVGIFVLHMIQMSIFLVVPGLLVEAAGLPLTQHWKVYLPVVGGGFVLMLPLMMRAERQGRVRSAFLAGIWLLTVTVIGLVMLKPTLVNLVVLLLVFFIGFNLLEALLPSLISRLAPPGHRGLAMGVYNTAQALGLFCGGLVGGWLMRDGGPARLFGVELVLLVIWWLAARGQRRWPGRDGATPAAGQPMKKD